jgi:predicted TPR repeat methyltransferase
MYRASIEFSRKDFSRETLIKRGKILQLLLPNNYTGWVGRRLCFQFANIEQIDLFEKMLARTMEKGTYKLIK